MSKTYQELDCTDYSNSFILVILSASLLIFSFPPFNFSFLAWFAFIPLFILIDELSPREVFAFYLLGGLIFWIYHIWWLTYVTFLGYSVLVIYLACYWGLWGLLLKFLKEKTQYPLIFLAPPLWVLFEFARMYVLTGLSWSLLGYSQWQNIPLIQISSITGVYGVSFLIVMLNSAISDFVLSKTKKQSRLLDGGGQVRNLILTLLLIAIIVAVGGRIISKEDKNQEKIKISVIQGNIPQVRKWEEGYEEQIIDIYTELSIEAAKSTNPSLIIWPETSYPGYIYNESKLFRKFWEKIYSTKTPLLIGGLNFENGQDYNSAFLILPNGEIKQTYNKLHLVPFGEYIPLPKIFSFLKNTTPQIGNFTKGKEYTIFETRNLESAIRNRFAVLICFEDVFPDLARRFTNKGASFLVVITNDAHFHESPALWQHLTHSVFRAVENRRPIVRAANNGISGFIDSYGRPIKILDENGKAVGVRGFATNQITPSSTKTFYTRFGDLFVYINILYLAVVLMIVFKKNAQK